MTEIYTYNTVVFNRYRQTHVRQCAKYCNEILYNGCDISLLYTVSQ